MINLFMAVAMMLPTLPPKQYDKPYKGRLHIQRLDPALVERLCGQQGAVACAGPTGPNSCRMIFPNKGYSKQFLDRLMRHELGHCNGWMPRSLIH